KTASRTCCGGEMAAAPFRTANRPRTRAAAAVCSRSRVRVVNAAKERTPARNRSTRAAQSAFVLLAGFCTTAPAFQIERAEAQFVEREYRFEMTALLEAPLED